MNINVDTALYITDEGNVGLYASIDNFERVIDSRTIEEMVEEYCCLLEVGGDQHGHSLALNMRANLLSALATVGRFIDATAADTARQTITQKE